MSAVIRQISGRMDAAHRPAWQVRALAVLAAIVVNVIILAVGRIAMGELPAATIGSDEQSIGFAEVIMTSAMVGLVAWALLALLERVTERAITIWTAVALVVFAVSLLGPITGGEDTGSKIVLAAMHVGAAAVIIPMLRESAAPHADHAGANVS